MPRYEEALAIAKEKGDKGEEGKAYVNLGECHFGLKDYALAIYYCKESLDIATDDTERARARKFLGLSYFELEKYKECIPHGEKCLEMFKRLNDHREITIASFTLATAYKKTKQYDKAEDKLRECIQMSRDMGYKRFEERSCEEIGSVYAARDNHDVAIGCFKRSLKLAKELDDPARMAQAYRNLGDSYYFQNQFASAIENYKECLQKAHNDKETIVLTYLRLGYAYFHIDRPDKAIKSFGLFFQTVDETTDKSLVAAANYGMGQSYAKYGDNEKFIKHYLELVKQVDNKKKALAHVMLGDAYRKESQYDDALKQYLDAWKIAEEQEYNEVKLRVDLKLGDLYFLMQDIQEAGSYYWDAMKMSKYSEEKESEADAYEGLGKISIFVFSFDDAVRQYKQCLKLAEELGDVKRKQRANEGLGDAHFALKEWSDASKNYFSSCDIAKRDLDKTVLHRCERKLGNACFYEGDYENAIVYHQRCLENAQKMDDKAGKAESYKLLGSSYAKINPPHNGLCLEFHEKYLEMYDEAMDKSEVAAIYLNTAYLLAKHGDYRKAVQRCEECLNLPDELCDSVMKLKLLEQLGDVFYDTQQYEHAFTQYHKISEEQVSLPQSRVYLKLGKVLLAQQNIRKAIQYYYEALEIAEDVKSRADVREALGHACYQKTDYKDAITHRLEHLELAENLGNERQQIACEDLGDAYSATKQWLQAKEYYCDAYKFAKEVGDKTAIGRYERKIGKAYYFVKDYAEAVKFLEKALENDTSQIDTEVYSFIGRAYAKIEEYERSKEYLFKCLKITTDRKDTLGQARVLGNIGRVYVKTGPGQFQNAIECHQKALVIIQPLNNKEEEAQVYCNLGCAYLASGQYDEAMENMKKFQQLAENLNDKQRRRALDKIGDIQTATGEYRSAIDSYLGCLELLKSGKVLEKLGCNCRRIGEYEMAIGFYSQLAEIAKDLMVKVRAFENVGNLYTLTCDYTEALSYHQQYLKIAKQNGDKAGEGRANANTGSVYLAKGQYDEALSFGREALQIAQGMRNKDAEAKAHGVMGCAYTGLGDYKSAEDSHDKETKVVEKLNDQSRVAEAQGNMGTAHIGAGKYQKAIDCFRKEMRLAINAHDEKAESRAHENHGSYHAAIGEYNVAIENYNEFLKIVEEAGDKAGMGRAKGSIGSAYTELGQYRKAIECHEEELKIAMDLENKVREAQALGGLGNAYTGLCQYQRAIDEYHQRDLQIVVKCSSYADERRANGNLGNAYMASGQYQKALDYLDKALEISKQHCHRAAEGRLHENMARAYCLSGQLQKAVDASQKSLDIAKEVGDKVGEGRASRTMGKTYMEFGGNMQRALDLLREYLRISKELGNTADEEDAEESMAAVCIKIGEYTVAIESYNEFLKIAEQASDKAGMGRAKASIGSAYTELGQYRKAIEYHEEELKIAMDLGNEIRKAQALGGLGNAYTGLCQYQRAIDEYHQRDLQIVVKCSSYADERRANGNLGNAYMASGQYQRALDYLDKALDISKQHCHRAAEGRLHENMARAYCLSGQLQKAVDASQKSLDIAKEIGDKAGKGRASGTMGKAYMEFGENMTALNLLREYLRISKELGNTADEADAEESMATVFIEIGEYERASKCCHKSLEIAKKLDDNARRGRAKGNLGNFYVAVGQYENAIKNHKEHLQIATDLGDVAEKGRANGNLGIAYSKKGEHNKAIECHEKERNVADKLGNEARFGRAQGNIGNTYAKIEHFQKAIECHEECLNVARNLNDKPSLAKAFLGLGESYKNIEQFEKARLYLIRVIEISKELKSKELKAIAQEMLGQCYQRNNISQACKFLAQSIISFQSIRPLSCDDFNISTSNRFAHVHKELFESLLNLNEMELTALLVSDCGKAQALYDLTRNIANSVVDYIDPMETIAQNPSSSTTKMLLFNKLSAVITAFRASTIISYSFGTNDDDLHVWVISQERLSVHKILQIKRSYLHVQKWHLYQNLDVGSAQGNTLQKCTKGVYDLETTTLDQNKQRLMLEDIESDHVDIQRLIDPIYNTTPRAPNPSTESLTKNPLPYLRDLHSALIKPVEEHLNGSKLLIVPEGPLFTLPFAALLSPGDVHLCEKYSLQFTPSLHVLNSSLQRPPTKLGPALFVGNPISINVLDGNVVKLRALPDAENEVARCSTYFNATPLMREMATKEGVLKGFSDASIIHIAAHGHCNRAEIFLTPNPGAMSIPESESYLLTEVDILKCTITARLVVLSCCYSGCGEISLEGVVGSARSFLGAGARSVLVTLWDIYDKKTMEFMIEFYEKVIQGYHVCAALQQTMVGFIHSRSRHWEAFQILGEDIVLTSKEIEEIRLVSTKSYQDHCGTEKKI